MNFKFMCLKGARNGRLGIEPWAPSSPTEFMAKVFLNRRWDQIAVC